MLQKTGREPNLSNAIGIKKRLPWSVSGTIRKGDASTLYSLTLSRSSSISASLTGLKTKMSLAVLDRRGQEIQKVHTSKKQPGVITSELQPGKYYLRVFPYRHNRATRYQLSLSALVSLPSEPTTGVAANATVNEKEEISSARVSPTRNITLNTQPSLSVTKKTVVFYGEVVRITNSLLKAEDLEQSPDSLTYSIVQLPVNGNLFVSNVKLNNGDQFTQADIDNGLLTYSNYLPSSTNITASIFDDAKTQVARPIDSVLYSGSLSGLSSGVFSLGGNSAESLTFSDSTLGSNSFKSLGTGENALSVDELRKQFKEIGLLIDKLYKQSEDKRSEETKRSDEVILWGDYEVRLGKLENQGIPRDDKFVFTLTDGQGELVQGKLDFITFSRL
jgi:hypothetical protein